MKNEVIIVNLPPARSHDYKNAGAIYPATGAMVIAAVLNKKGLVVSLVDGALNPDYEQIVLERVSNKTAFVGFSTMTSQITMAYDLARNLKRKHPDILTVVGGTHPTLFPEQTVTKDCFNIAVINEGIKTVLEIMEYINGTKLLKDINGIAYCDQQGRICKTPARPLDDISDFPFFDFGLLNDTEKYLNSTSVYERELNLNGNKKIRLMPILTGLGCCFRCAFCINVILKRRYRTRSAEDIIQEIKRLQYYYDANAFLFLDEDFCIDKRRLSEFIQRVKDEKLKFYGRIWTRVSYFRQEGFLNLIPEMERIGIKSIAMGAESASQRILNYICKDIKCSDIVVATKELSKTQITPRLSFIVGIDGEKRKETAATYKMCAQLLKINPRTDIAGPFTFRYYPGSPIFQEMVKKYNITLPQHIEDWKDSLNDDGSLTVDSTDWTWPGFYKYSYSMNKYLTLYMYFLNHPGYRNNNLVKLIKKLVIWRLESGEYGYDFDYLFFQNIKKLRVFLKKLKEKYKGGVA